MCMQQIVRFYLVLVFSLHGYQAFFAQNAGLNRDYYFEQRATLFTSVRQFGDDVVVVGQSGTDSTFISSFFVLQLDTLGEIQKLDFYKDSSDHTLVNSFYYDAICPTVNNGFLISGNMFSRNSVFAVLIDSLLRLTEFTEYGTDALARFTRNIYYHDNFYYITGLVSKPDHDLDVFVLKTDKLLNRIWEKTYGNPEYSDNGSSAVLEDGGITVLVGEWMDPSHLEYNDERRWTKFIHIDTSGSIQWQWKSEENEEAGSPNGLVKAGSDYIYFTRPGYQVSPAEVHFGTQIICRDRSLNLVWRKDYSNIFAYQGFNDMVMGPDGYLYVTGQIYEEVMWGRIFKIDPANGDVIWQARDTGLWRENWGSRNVMEGITVLPSGSVVAVGYTWAGLGVERGFVIKATKDGCIDTLCTTSTIDEFLADQSKKVKVYPNPTTDYLIFEIDEDLYDTRVEIFDLHGRMLQHQKMRPGVQAVMLDEGRYTPGIYVWRIVTEQGGLVKSGKFVVK